MKAGLVIFTALAAAVPVAAVAASCSSKSASSSSSAAGGATTSSTTGGGAGPSTSGSGAGSCDAHAPNQTTWSIDTDSCWHPVAWPQQGGIEVADEPALAVPPLEWEPCTTGAPGCLKMRIRYDHRDKAGWIQGPHATRWGGGYRVGLVFAWKKDTTESRTAIYDADGTALAAWRADASYAGLTPPRPQASRVWLDAAWFPDNAANGDAYLAPGYGELSTIATVLPIPPDAFAQTSDASDDILGMQLVDGLTAGVYDRIDQSFATFGPSQTLIGCGTPKPAGTAAVLRCFPLEPSRTEPSHRTT